MGLIQTGWGRLGREVEVQYSQTGFAFGKVGIACKIPKKNADGSYGTTEWVELTFLGKAAETAASMLQKGSKIWFTGYPQTEEWEDKQNPGQKKKQIRVVVQQWEALDPNPNAQGGGFQQGGQQQGGQQQGGGGGFQQPQQQGGGFQPQGQPQAQPQQGGFNPNQPGNPPQGQQFQPQGNAPPQNTPQQQPFQPQGNAPAQNNPGPGQGFGPAGGAGTGTGDDVPF